jgi:hypothetical protein
MKQAAVILIWLSFESSRHMPGTAYGTVQANVLIKGKRRKRNVPFIVDRM